MPICAECGMPVDKATTYHPYAACLMFKACQSSEIVQANLDAVVAHGIAMEADARSEREALDDRVDGTRSMGFGDDD